MAKGKKKSTKKKTTTKPPAKEMEETIKEEAPSKPAEEIKEVVKEEPPPKAEEPPAAETVPAEKPAVEVKKEAPKENPPEKKKPAAIKAKKEEEIPEDISDEFERIEYQDPFNKERAFKHTESLAIPRLVGTEGERKAASYIKDKFNSMGLKPVEEKFTFTDWSFEVLPRVFEAIESALIVLIMILLSVNIVLTPTNPAFIIALVVSIILLGFLFYTSIPARFYWKFQNKKGKVKFFEGKDYESQNIVAKVDCKKGKDAASGEIILLAHYDSKSQMWPMSLRVILFYIESIATLILPIGVIALFTLVTVDMTSIPPLNLFTTSDFQIPFLVVLWVFATIDLVTYVFLELNKTGNNSPGALDNASGVGVFMELAENYSKTPLENYNLTFVATSAEEMGLMGTVAYLKAHESELDKDDTYFINLKITGVRGHFYIPGPVGFPPHLPCLEIENLFKKTLKRRQIPLQEGSKKIIKVVSPWVFGTWNDDMIPLLRGFNGNRISIGGFLRRYDVIHSELDTINKVDIESIDIVGKVTTEVLTRLDLRARP